MTTWSELLAQPGVILADGAMGTMLMANGLAFGNSPELWNVDEPHRVGEIHAAYVQAGARILLTNTFGGNRFRLQLHNLQERAAELNRAAARLAREAAGGAALVAGDIGPSGGILAPLGELEPEAAVAGFAEQAAALVEGGVDVIWLETMSSLEEMRAAFDGVRRASADIPIITTMTFDTRGRTMMGVTPERAAQTLSGWGAVAVGGNCGNGPEEILEVVAKMRAMAPAATLVAKANAGVPHLLAGRPVYGAGPDDMARYAIAAAEAGARVIGACCGSTPDHLRAMRNALAAKGLL
ncbi:MAG TPA: homocysteine S-methyltransferase family protein [Anaerolineales bacterium]|nr:homocysteine S-methyltransferase family protein [Anaerolineales bacterium]